MDCCKVGEDKWSCNGLDRIRWDDGWKSVYILYIHAPMYLVTMILVLFRD